MPFPIAKATNFGFATRTQSVLFAILISMDVSGSYPFPASSGWTVDPVFGVVFLEFTIPSLLERDVKKAVYVMKWNMIVCTTLGRHVLRVCDGELEVPF